MVEHRPKRPVAFFSKESGIKGDSGDIDDIGESGVSVDIDDVDDSGVNEDNGVIGVIGDNDDSGVSGDSGDNGDIDDSGDRGEIYDVHRLQERSSHSKSKEKKVSVSGASYIRKHRCPNGPS